MKKRSLIILLSLVGLIVALAATAFFLGRSEKGHQMVVEKSLSALEEALEARVTIGSTSGNLLGRLVWNDVTMVRDDLEVRVERLSFRIDYLALRDSHIHLKGFKAVNPRVKVKEPWIKPESGPGAPKGEIAEADLAPPSTVDLAPPATAEEGPAPAAAQEQEKGWRVSLDGASLSGGVLQGLALALGRPGLGDLNQVNAKVDFTIDRDIGVIGDLTGLVEVGGKPVRLEIKGGYADQLIKAKGLKIKFGPEGRSALELKGLFDPLALTGQADYKADLEPLDLHQLLNAILPGAVDLDLLDGRMALAGQVDYPGNKVGLSLKGSWQKAGLELKGDLDPRTMNLDCAGQVSDLDPARLAKISGMELPQGLAGFKFVLKGTVPDSLDLDLDLDKVDLNGYGKAEKGAIKAGLEHGVLDLKAGLSGLAGFKAGVERLDLEGRVDPQGVRALVSFTNATGYKAKADSGRFNLAWEGDTLTVSNLDLARDQGRITGSLQARMDQGRVASGRADLNLDGFNPPTALVWDLMGLYMPVVDLSSVKLTGPVKADWPGKEMKLSFPGLKLDSEWGKIQGPGMIKLNAQGELDEYALDLDVTRFAVPGWLWSFLPVELKKAIVNGRVKVKGDQYKAIFEADLGGTDLNGNELKKFTLSGKYGSKGVFVDGLDLSFLGTEIKAKGQAWPRLDLKAGIKGSSPQKTMERLQSLGLALEPLPFSVAGYGFEGTVKGDYLAPAIKGSLSLAKPALDKYQAQEIDLDLDLKRVPFKDIQKLAGNIQAKVKQADLGRGEKFDLDITATSTEKGAAGRFNAAGAGLRAASDWNLALTSARETDLVLDNLEFTLPKGKGKETWRSAQPLEIDLDQGSFKQAKVHLAGPDNQSLDLDLTHLAGAVSGRGRLQGLNLGSWATALGLENVDRGFVTASLEVGGSLNQPSLKLQGQVKDLVFLGKPAGQTDWTLTLDRGQLTAAVTGRNKDREFLRGSARMGLLTGEGPTDLRPDLRSLRLDLDIDGLDLAAWAAALKDDRFKEGLLYARLTSSGPPDDIRATLDGRVKGLVVLDQDMGDMLLKAELRDRRVTGQAEVRDKAETLLKASGSMALPRDPRTGLPKPDLQSLKADIRVNGLNLSRFGPAVTKVEGLAGTMNAELDLAPRPKGWIKVKGLQFRVADTGQVVEEGQLSLVLDRTRLTLEECLAQTGGGTLKGSGWMDFSGDMPLEFKADLSRTEMLLGPYGRSRIEAALAVSQNLEAPLISGKVSLKELHFRQPKSSLEDSQEIILVDDQLDGRQPQAPPERLKMAIDVDLGDKTPIQGEGLRAWIGGNLKILKDPGKSVRVKGESKIKEGLYARFGRRFIIQEGKLVFSGREKPDPTLNISAATRVNSVDIYLGIGGTATKPDFILSSMPAMDRDEILSYLIFGQSSSGYSENENGKMGAQTIGLLGGPATELVKGIVSDRLAPDSVAVSASTEGGVAVEAGKQLLPNLFFSYVAYSEPTKPNEFKVEYRIAPNVAVESTVGDPETMGVDINFKYDF